MSAKGALNAGAAGRVPANLRATRSNTKTITQPSNASPQAATLEKKKAKAREIEAEARKTLMSEKCLGEETVITHHTLLHTLSLLIQKYNETAPQSLTIALMAMVALLQQANNASTQLTPVVDTLSQMVGERIEKTMQDGMDKLSTLFKTSLAEQSKSFSPPEALGEAVTTLKQVASEMSKTINEATTATSQINDTAINYKQALMQTSSQATNTKQNTTHTSPKAADAELQLGINKKARQILLDTVKGEDNSLNIYEIKEKVTAALAAIVPAPPNGSEIQEVIKLRNGSVILQFTTKEAAEWLRVPENEVAFTRRYDPDTTIRDRVHPIMVPRIPLTFDPNNPTHLREIEEVNRLAPNTIKKARWIKPEYRRAPGQSCAHGIITLASATDANAMLKDGIYICNARLFPKKLKFEPKQCMKCRKWGHFAAECRSQNDVCGTCGGQHKTNACNAEGRRYCVSCRSDSHASWDRNCPEFRRKCDEYSTFHPENNLVYFPTDEDWTTVARPARIPFEDKFPERYTVGSLPPPNRTERQMPTRPIGKKGKHANRAYDNSQAVLDTFFYKPNHPHAGTFEIPPAQIDDDDEEYEVQFEALQNTLSDNFLKQPKA